MVIGWAAEWLARCPMAMPKRAKWLTKVGEMRWPNFEGTSPTIDSNQTTTPTTFYSPLFRPRPWANSQHHILLRVSSIMSTEDPQERPAEIHQIINGLERYNPEAVGPLEAYLQQQCEQRFTDANANRVLLKLYVQLFPRRISFSSLHQQMYCNDDQTQPRFLLPDLLCMHEVTFISSI